MGLLRGAYWFITVLWLWLNPVQAQTLLLPVNAPEIAELNLAPYLQLLEDPSKQLRFEQVSSAAYDAQFVANTADVLNVGRTQSAWWVRFQLRSEQDIERFLLLNHPIGGRVDFFMSPAPLQTTLHRLEQTRLPTFHLQLAAYETITLYLRIENGQALLILPLQLLTPEQLLQTTTLGTLIYTTSFVGMMTLTLYNLLLFLSLRDKVYLSLVLFIIATNLLCLRESHLIPMPAWIYDPRHYFYTAPILLALAAPLHYWGLVNQGRNRILALLCTWLPRLALATIPFCGLLPQGERLLFGQMLLLTPIILLLATREALQGHRATRRSYWTIVILLLGSTPYLAMQVGLLAYDVWFVYVVKGSILIALLLLSFAQAEQTRWVREEKERIDASSKAKDSFLTTMSHELRTPIHAITGVAELLRHTLRSSEQHLYLDKLLASSQHLHTLVNDILDLSRIEAERMTINPVDFSFDHELAQLQQMFSLIATQKGLRLALRQETLPNLQLYGDAVRLRQILVNLLSNALKFTHHGSVTLTVRQLTLTPLACVRLYFEVTDTGIGITAEQQRFLFHPFTQVDSSTTRRYGGSGLGLVISRRLVELMGGNLGLESQAEQGSRFFFTLDFPVLPVAEIPPVVHDLGCLHGRYLQALLVDDDPLNCFLCVQMLERLGVQASVAHSGQAALQQLPQRLFDVVLMDISMPEMDGYATTQAIRQAGFTHLPIIAVTAHAIDGEQERCIAAGMNGYLSKPFNLAALHATLCQFVGQTATKILP